MKIPMKPPGYHSLMTKIFGEDRPDPGVLTSIVSQSALANGQYRHWDKVRHLKPPNGLSLEEWWLGIKIARDKLQRKIALKDKHGQSFVYGMPDHVQEALHEITQQASGRLESQEQVTNASIRDRYIVSSLIDEAITSSQLEGAATTTQVAKDMLRSGRRPRDRGEQMILNNFQAMKFVQKFTDRPLEPDLVFTLHRIVTERTLDDPSNAGTLRDPDDKITVNDRTDGKVLHIPPPSHELPKRIEELCAFANGDGDDGFMHPVIRAIIIHFWVGYDHPFVDGNGRTARALFYWSMIRQGYWLAQFFSISSILKKSPTRYALSYLYTETDDNDLTYFIDYHLTVIRRAMHSLLRYLDRKAQDVRDIEQLMRGAGSFNHRQLALLGHALRHPGARYTFDSHKRSHDVAYQTARTDLLKLAKRGFLIENKIGRQYQFEAPTDLGARLRRPESP